MKIYDCFIFMNELDLLEIRLNELSSMVDRFVLVEMAQTFTGKPKPLVFEEHRNDPRFLPFVDRIDHIIAVSPPGVTEPSQVEHYQRNAVLKGLSSCAGDDMIMISDVDEIPRPEVVKAYSEPQVMLQSLYYYYVNMACVSTNILGTVILPRDKLRSPQWARDRRFNFAQLQGAGWHFSWLGGPEAIRLKLGSFADTKYDTEFIRAGIERHAQEGTDFMGRGCLTYHPVPINGSFPRYLVHNQDRFKHLIREVPV